MGQCVGHFIWSTGCVSVLACSSLPEYNLQSLLLLRGSAIYFYTVCAVDTLCRWPIYCAVPGGDFWWYSWLIFLHSSSYSAKVHTVLSLNVLKIVSFVLAHCDKIKATCSHCSAAIRLWLCYWIIYLFRINRLLWLWERLYFTRISVWPFYVQQAAQRIIKKQSWSQIPHDFCLLFDFAGFH